MANIVIDHCIRTTHGIGDLYNRYDGMPMPWDERLVTYDTVGLVKKISHTPLSPWDWNVYPNLIQASQQVLISSWVSSLTRNVIETCKELFQTQKWSQHYVELPLVDVVGLACQKVMQV
jgi:alpha-amylase